MAKTMRDLVNDLNRAKQAEQQWLRRSEAEAMKNRGGTLYNAWARQGPVDIAAYRNTMGGNPHAARVAELSDRLRQMRSGGGRTATRSNSGAPGGVNLGGLDSLLAAYQSTRQAQMPSLADQLSAEYARKLEEANAANEARYQQGLGELTDLRTRSMADIANVGQQQAADIDSNFNQAAGAVQQDLSRRGLLGTSRISSEAQRLQESRASAQNRLAEQLAMARIGVDQSTTGGLTGWIERRNDNAPELNQLIALQQGLGSSGMLGSTAYGGGMPPGAAGGGLAGILAGGAAGGSMAPYLRSPSFQQQQGVLPAGGPTAPMVPYGQGGANYPQTAAEIDPNRVLSAQRDPVASQIQTLLTQQLSRMTGRGGRQQAGAPMVGPTIYNRPTGGMSIARPSGGGMMMGAPIFAGSGQFAVPGMAMGQMPQMQRGVYSNWTPTPYGRGQQSAQALPAQTVGGPITRDQRNTMRIRKPGGQGYGVSTPTIQNPYLYA